MIMDFKRKDDGGLWKCVYKLWMKNGDEDEENRMREAIVEK